MNKQFDEAIERYKKAFYVYNKQSDKVRIMMNEISVALYADGNAGIITPAINKMYKKRTKELESLKKVSIEKNASRTALIKLIEEDVQL